MQVGTNGRPGREMKSLHLPPAPRNRILSMDAVFFSVAILRFWILLYVSNNPPSYLYATAPTYSDRKGIVRSGDKKNVFQSRPSLRNNSLCHATREAAEQLLNEHMGELRK